MNTGCSASCSTFLTSSVEMPMRVTPASRPILSGSRTSYVRPSPKKISLSSAIPPSLIRSSSGGASGSGLPICSGS
jgi:hypothetical protein